MPARSRLLALLAGLAGLLMMPAAQALEPAPEPEVADTPYDDLIVIHTSHDFDTLWTRLENAVQGYHMLLMGRMSPSRAAAQRGKDIPGNGVIEVFRNDFSMRLLSASVAAGIETPLRFYLTEEPDGTATVSFRQPSAIFAPYHNLQVSQVGAELDEIFDAIAYQAALPDRNGS